VVVKHIDLFLIQMRRKSNKNMHPTLYTAVQPGSARTHDCVKCKWCRR